MKVKTNVQGLKTPCAKVNELLNFQNYLILYILEGNMQGGVKLIIEEIREYWIDILSIITCYCYVLNMIRPTQVVATLHTLQCSYQLDILLHDCWVKSMLNGGGLVDVDGIFVGMRLAALSLRYHSNPWQSSQSTKKHNIHHIVELCACVSPPLHTATTYFLHPALVSASAFLAHTSNKAWADAYILPRTKVHFAKHCSR